MAITVPAGQPEEDLAERIVRRFVAACEHPVTRGLMIRLAKGSVGDARGVGRHSTALTRFAFTRLVTGSRAELTVLRTQLVMIQLAGMAITRYGLELEPMASLSPEQVIALVTPSVRAALSSDSAAELVPAHAWPEERPYPATDWSRPDLRRQYKMTGRLGG